MTESSPKSAPARWWYSIAEEGKVVCTLCPRECHIPEGSRGFCFVRANEGGKLALTTYSRSTGFSIDPIEKKPLHHFLPGTSVLSFGTAGCNLGCKFCQNWDTTKSRNAERTGEEATPGKIVQAALQTGCRSIAFTYNDPVIWAEYAIDVARLARAAGIKTVAVTAGYINPEPRQEFFSWMDAANVDLKSFSDTFYRKLSQVRLQPVLDTIEYVNKNLNCWMELTNLLIPGENDSPQETADLCRWLVDHVGPNVPIHFSAFHPAYKMQDTPATPPETLLRAREQALAAGLKYAYIGNVDDRAHESTYCPCCGTLLIERDWYEIGAYGMNENRCGKCGTLIPGVFGEAPGHWGRRRRPVSM